MPQAKTQTLSLGEHWNNFIESHLQSGRYATASEMVREELRLLEEKGSSQKSVKTLILARSDEL